MSDDGRGARVSARVSPITRAKLLRLVDEKVYISQTAVLDVAIDRLYREAFGTDALPEGARKEGESGC